MEQRAFFAPVIVRRHGLPAFHTRPYVSHDCRQEGGAA